MTAPTLTTLPIPQPTPDTPMPHPMPPPNVQAVFCPTCGGGVDSLLAACWKPACLTADADYDAAIDARCEL